MVMDISLFGTLRKLKLSSTSLRVDDDFVDRLNHYYTGIIIIIFTIIVSAKQYVGQPLQCWVPAQFTHAMEQYTENFCWVQNTYWLPLEKYIPKENRKRDELKIGYYQWVPFVLVCEALMFYMPCVIWRLLNWQSGISVQGIVRMACDAQNVDPDNRKKTIRTLTRHIEDALSTQRIYSSNTCGRLKACLACFICSKRFGSYLGLLYLIMKLLYIANVCGQFFLLNNFLGTKRPLYGLDIFMDLVVGRDWLESGNFPRVTMCDFQIRVLGNIHRYTVQCVLMINLFNEKIFIFLWFWFLIIAIVTSMNLLMWINRLIIPLTRQRFVKKYLRIMRNLHPAEKKIFKNFTDNYLRMDGVFVLRMIALNSGDIIATDTVNQLWNDFRNKKTITRIGPEDAEPPLPAYI